MADSLGLNYRVAEFSILTDEEFIENTCHTDATSAKKSLRRSQKHR